MIRKHFELGETAVTIVGEEEFIPVAEVSIFRSRDTIERFIRWDPLFQLTLEPYEPPEDCDPLIRRMCTATAQAGVGPMASVAGAIAERAVMDMLAAGADQAIVDNGGDIALLLKEEVGIGIYAGEQVKGLGFACAPREGVFGICTSSATIGPSISFGVSDAAITIASNVALADACATRLGNLLISDEEEVMCQALDDVCSISGVEGALAVVGGKMGVRGRLPRLVPMRVPADRVARIELGSAL